MEPAVSALLFNPVTFTVIFVVIAAAMIGITLIRATATGGRVHKANKRFAATRGWPFKESDAGLARVAGMHPFAGNHGDIALHAAVITEGGVWSAMFSLRTFSKLETHDKPTALVPRTDAIVMVATHLTLPYARIDAFNNGTAPNFSPRVRQALDSPALKTWTVVMEPGRVFATKYGYVNFARDEGALLALREVVAALENYGFQ